MTPDIIAKIEAEIERLRGHGLLILYGEAYRLAALEMVLALAKPKEPEAKMTAEEREIAQRRFGSRHDKPCRRPTILTCALWDCQQANECQHGA